SIFSSNDSIISNTTFEFDAEIINSRAYRQVMQNRRRRNAGFTRTNLQPTVEDVSDEESDTYVATAAEEERPDEPQRPPPVSPRRPARASPDAGPPALDTTPTSREPQRSV